MWLSKRNYNDFETVENKLDSVTKLDDSVGRGIEVVW